MGGGQPPEPGNNPTVGLIPETSDGWLHWHKAGSLVIPQRTTIYKTLSPSGDDDAPQIQAALDSCPSGQVVKLTKGVFNVSRGVVLHTPCTLRGSSPGKLLTTGLNQVNGGGTVRNCFSGSQKVTLGNGSYCTDDSATQIIASNRENGVYPTIEMWASGTVPEHAYALASNAVKGEDHVTLADDPSPAIKVGDIVFVGERAEHDPNVYYGTSFANNMPNSQWWNTCPGKGAPTGQNEPDQFWRNAPFVNLCQMLQVKAIEGKKITFDTPLNYAFRADLGAWLSTRSKQPLRGSGVEDLFVWGGSNNVRLGCDYCWVKNIDSAWSNGAHVWMSQTFRAVLRDNVLHESPQPQPGGGGYIMVAGDGASENLIENNVMWNGNKVNIMENTGGGNVFAYNYTDDSFGNQYIDSPEAGINAGHRLAPHVELLEGNYSPNFKGDAFWGGSIRITVFRNHLSGLRAARDPLNTFTAPNGGCLMYYGDYNGGARAPVDIQAGSYENNLIGNVLGFKDMPLLTEPRGPDTAYVCNIPQSAFMEQVTTKSENDDRYNGNKVPMWAIGADQSANSFVDNTIDTITRTANWDWFTQKQHCYGRGGTTDQGCSGITLPNSFYLDAKPAFFGSNPWPWVDPTTGHTDVLPAKACFDQGKMPNCMEQARRGK
jgi:hypothetical protein